MLPNMRKDGNVCHDIDIEVHGEIMSHCTVELDQGETVVAEAGALLSYDEGITYEAKFGDGSKGRGGILGGLMSAASRMISGESAFLTHFTNNDPKRKTVKLSATVPGAMCVIDMGQFNNPLICNRGSFLCGALGTKISMKTDISVRGLFGESFFLQKIEGDGKICLNAGGAIVQRFLENETIFVDNSCLLAYVDGDIEYSVVKNGGIKSMLFSGEGLSMVKLSGTGMVLLQTTPFDRFAGQVGDSLVKQGVIRNSSGGGVSVDFDCED